MKDSLSQEVIKRLPCGVHHASFENLLEHMPDLKEILESFPDDPEQFSWDVKVHMLMPDQYPCIPNWHCDFVPRENGIQKFSMCNPDLPMYLWVSNGPLTQFKHGFIQPRKWVRFTQLDEHRGIASDSFQWRVFIRATHKEICPVSRDWIRVHSQVYIDPEKYQW